jgi:predicted metal-dependent hydrolase
MFPLPLRNALAHLAIDALDHDDARAALAWLARRDGAPGDAAARLAHEHLTDPGASDVLEIHAPHDAGIRAHAAHALAAADAYRRHPAGGGDALAGAIARAAALWDARLFFEVHEVLEAVWQRASGDTRQALQGIIQIAVAFHHLAAGNLRGARQLMTDGRGRLAATATVLPVVDANALLELTAPWEQALAAARPVPAAAAPRFPRRDQERS